MITFEISFCPTVDEEIDIIFNEFADNIWYPSFLPTTTSRTTEGVEFLAM